MKKKILALILSVGLLLSCLPVSTVAVDAATVVAEGYTTTPGNYAYINLRADNFVNIGAVDIDVYYDSSVMRLDYTSNGSFLSSALVSTNTSTSGVVKISVTSLNGLNSTTSSYSNRIMTLGFVINSDCPVGDYPITVAVGDAYDGDFNPASITGKNGAITVQKASAQSFYFSTSLSTYTVNEADEFTLRAYNSNRNQFASADFTIEYDRDLLKLKSIELDSSLLVEGAFYSINDKNPGYAKISYATTNAISPYNLFKITFEVISNTEANTPISVSASDVYIDSQTAYKSTTTSSTVSIKEKEVVPDYPDFRLDSQRFVVGEASDIDVILEGNSKVAAADFVINYDADVFTINSVTAVSETLSKGAMIVVGKNISEGQIRFSYIMQNGDFTEDTALVKISATPLIVPEEHYSITTDGIEVCDINFNDVQLDYLTDSDCIFLPTVIEPTCTEDGYTSYDCSCGEFYTTDPTPSLGGHKYGDFVIDTEQTCTQDGEKSRYCSVCGDRTDITVDKATGHNYSDWIFTIVPTCTEKGAAHKICGNCGDIKDTISDVLLDSETYPESQHQYGNNISKTYNFSYPDAVSLKLTFSSSTETESNYDFLYIYDSQGNLYGKYSGSALAGAEITLEGNSFSLKLTTDGSVTRYGFSFDSIVAVIEDDVIKPLGHKYSEEWTIDIEPTCTEKGSKSHHCTVCGDKADITAIEVTEHSFETTDVMAAHPHTITYTCSDCGTEKAEDSIDSSCIECMHIVGLENTRVDYENHLIFTTIQVSSDITEIIGVYETAKAIPIASHLFGDYEFFGTGTIISVYNNDEYIGDYTLIVSGDVNGDSVCNVLDCAQVALVTNNHKTFDDVYALAADVNMDEVIDMNDYQEIVNIALAS